MDEMTMALKWFAENATEAQRKRIENVSDKLCRVIYIMAVYRNRKDG
jgi:hypothetical protein